MPTRVILPIMVLAFAGCAREPSSLPPGEKLETSALAAHASEFYCESGRWPHSIAELHGFPLPERSRIQPAPDSAPVPWALLDDATLAARPDGSLLISASLPAGSLVDGPPSRPVELSLIVEEPGCWPPVSAPGQSSRWSAAPRVSSS